MEQPKATVDYVRLLRRVVTKRWRIVLIVFMAVAVPTIAWTFLGTENTYEASATLFLLPEKGAPGFLPQFMNPEVHVFYHAILRSRSLAQGVVEALPKESRDELSRRLGTRDYVLSAVNQLRRWRGQEVVVYSPTELAIRELQEARTTFTIAKDGTVAITATAFSPRVAVDLANTYVEVLLSRSSAFARQQARGTRELLETLLTQAKSNQGEAETALRKIQVQGGAIKLPDESRVDLQRLTQLETALADVQVSREIAQSRLLYLKGDRKSGRPLEAEPVTDAPAQPLRERLFQVETKLASLQEKYTEQHPLVQAARTEVQEAQDRLKTFLQGQQGPRPAGAATLKPLESAQLSKQMADLEVEIISLRTKEDGYQQRIARLKQSMSAMGAREQEYAGLARTAETQAKLTGMLAEKLSTARMSEQSQIQGIQVIDLAALPRQPSAKQPLRFVLLGLLGGLGLGIGAAVLREHSLQLIESEMELATATGLPVLGSIPTARAPRNGPAGESKPTIFVATHDPHSLPADACRAIRTAIDCHGLDSPLRTMLVTSAGAHEGKTTVLLNLALAFVESGRRVLVIDADLRRPSIHRVLEIPNEAGLADMLEKGEIWPEGFRGITPGLEVLPSGIKSRNPGALLGARHTTTLLKHARERADLVLIDSPPVVAVSDCLPLAAQVDGVILVTRFGVTQRRNAIRAKDLLEKAGARVVGVVLNGLSTRETRRYYAAYSEYIGATKVGRRKHR
ncbi:MAG TPA: polysaccharide biosynthesis tyrosine autokinase [Candidatus Acidoferrum sp.]|nr:polysaccharide biosynthesis tyrosine autokinase [Candidatus Acidoferrum sp.]